MFFHNSEFKCLKKWPKGSKWIHVIKGLTLISWEKLENEIDYSRKYVDKNCELSFKFLLKTIYKSISVLEIVMIWMVNRLRFHKLSLKVSFFFKFIHLSELYVFRCTNQTVLYLINNWFTTQCVVKAIDYIGEW